MDKLNKDTINNFFKDNKQSLAIGGVILGCLAGVAYYLLVDSKKHARVEDTEKLAKSLDAKEWPKLRRIVDPSADKNTQQKQINNWMNIVFAKYMKLYG